MKKILLVLFFVFICLQTINTNVFADSNFSINVKVEGNYIWFDEQSPIIVDGRTLIPIRSVAEKIGAKVEWEASTETITIIKGGITLSLKIGDKTMQVNGKTFNSLDVAPKVYNGKTLLPIRAVLEKLGYDVQWNEQTRTINIEEIDSVIISNLKGTHANYDSNWANISSVHQFNYKDEGLAYAYVKDGNLQIVAPSKVLSIEIKYPILGDVISDDNGNFYVVWGRDNDTDDASIETVYISKYLSDGTHVKTTGFVGKSSPWGNDNSAKTKRPFRHGNSVSVIANGILVNYHSKQRYDGHQSDNVVAVKISDMSPYKLPNDTFSGHSFNQSLIFSKMTSDFFFASHGDAYIRGFRINNSSGKYGDDKQNIFHFYLEANANYDMFIVNRTFAQLGNIAETSKGIALVGASAKSISEAAKEEKQNLFVQIFNPNFGSISSKMFIGGEERSGATSTNINDNNNSPLKKVTDYGVIWLTDYTEENAIAPQLVEADDKLVILWSTENDSFYMILSSEGKILTPATSLGGLPLNSYERPIYHNGSIYWVSVYNERLKVRKLDLEK